MKLKRLIAFTVVMAVIMSCFCAVSTTVFADEIAPRECATYSGSIKITSTGNVSLNQKYSYTLTSGDTWSDEAGGESTKATKRIHQNSGVIDSSKVYISLTNSDVYYNKGYVQSVDSGDDERGYVYEVTYGGLKSNVYKNDPETEKMTTVTKDLPVLLYSYYIYIPESSKNDVKEQIFRLYNGSYTQYTRFYYSNGKVTLKTTEKTKMDLLWGAGEFNVDTNRWYKFEGRACINEDNKLCLGIYVDDVQIAYYVQKETDKNDFSETLTMYQYDFWGDDDGASLPGLTYYDDIHYGLYPASYIPSATEVELSEADDVATAKIYGNSIKSANLIVALYDNMDRLAGIKSSDVISVDVDKVTGSRTITCPFPTGVTYDSYKLFLFDSLTSLKPLTEMVPSK